MLKQGLSWLLWPLALGAQTVGDKLRAIWSFTRLRSRIRGPLHVSNVILGPVRVEGTGNVHIGRHARIYPGVMLETQGQGRIDIGDNVVLSAGVHIVAFESVVLGDDCMVGEYSSIRDADHRRSPVSMRLSGHHSAPVRLGRNVWVGRGACLLKGVSVGSNVIVGANAVVNQNIPDFSCAVGVPARARSISFAE
jgi:acetyltransferase-like isoleucine patch superfamily enzyme